MMEKIGQSIGKIRQTITQRANCKIDESVSVESQSLIFNDRLSQIIRPRNQSDRTCFRRITNWILRGIKEGKCPPETFEKVLVFAVEAAGPDSRNPAAVFMKILKEEMGYGKEIQKV